MMIRTTSTEYNANRSVMKTIYTINPKLAWQFLQNHGVLAATAPFLPELVILQHF